jgi:hypothetical protein
MLIVQIKEEFLLRNTAKFLQVLIALDAASNLPPCSCVFTDAQLPCCVKRISELHQPFAANMVKQKGAYQLLRI